MAVARIAALLSAVALASCEGPAAVRTRLDLEEIGRARLGEVEARIDQGVTAAVDAERRLVRFRANAPDVSISFRSESASEQVFNVELENVALDSLVSVPSAKAGENALSFVVKVPPRGEAKVTSRPRASATVQPFAFAWVGDVQGGNEPFERIRERINADPTVEFVVFAGDITNQGSQDQIDAFVAVADGLTRPWYSVLGNHETLQGEPVAFQRTVGRINVRFDYRGARFVLLDGASGTLDPWARDFLAQAVAGGGPRARVVAMHMPLLDPEGFRDGGFSDRAEAAQLLAVLAKGGTDLLLAGHLHTLRHTSQGGIQTWVSGNGGVDFGARFDGTGMHYLRVQVDPASDRLDVTPVLVD